MNPFFYQAESAKTFETVINDLKKAIENHGFSVLSIIDMQKKFQAIGKESKGLNIVQLCNAEMSYHAISMSKNMSCMMPKDINVYEDENNKVQLVFMRANTELLEKAFPNMNISEISGKVGKILQSIIEEAI